VRLLPIAVVQMQSLDHDIDANLRRATNFTEQAVARGAQFVLLPEFMATGSYLSFDTWDSSEPSHGKSVQWLKSTSRRLRVWLGASFLEASGSDFYDTFVLTAPSGEEAGRVRKQIPACPEAYFFRGEEGSHVISTAIGKIGVGICAEKLPSPPGTHLASWYARKLGVPVALVNKVGRSYKPPPDEINGVFPGRSAIVDSDASVLLSMDRNEGIGFATMTLDPSEGTGDLRKPSQVSPA